MSSHTFNVAMTCSGCSGAVERSLKKLEGVSNITIDMEGQTVTVEGSEDKDTLLAQIKKTGKECSYKE